MIWIKILFDAFKALEIIKGIYEFFGKRKEIEFKENKKDLTDVENSVLARRSIKPDDSMLRDRQNRAND